MGRSKNLHFVQHTVTIEQPDDPRANWDEGYIQVDQVLSEELGRTIRNGNSFRLVGFGANLKGFTTAGDQDIGFAGTAAVNFCPVTKNSVGAWQSLQKQWMKQKSLASAVGKYVRYDDFELGWSSATPLIPARNSTIRMGGLNDSSQELVGIYGDSLDGTYVALETYYDNMNPIPAVSEDPFGAVIKTAKFENKFPDQKTLIMPTSFSAQAFDSLTPHGGIANGDISWLPSDNHISHLTGTLFWYFKGVTPDVQFVADELKLTITLVYEGWAPLAKTRSSKPVTRKQMSTAAKAKSTTNARRRS